jgi:sarcosine oxidase delta subunit
MDEKTVKCPICGKPYKVYSMYAGDQSACPKCVEEAEKNMGKWQELPYRKNQ